MSCHDRTVATNPIRLEPLEDRCVPVRWPVQIGQNQVAELLGTYGQYQERPLNQLEKQELGLNPTTNVDISHIHEGLDIKAPAGTLVRVVMTGWVEAVYRYPGDPFNSFVVIRDVVTDLNGDPVMENGKPKLGPKGWNYLHVLPDANFTARQLVLEGAPIGTVAPIPPEAAGYGDHLHLDRGLAGTDPARDKTRDLTLASTGAYRLSKRLATTGTLTPAERQRYTSLVEALRWRYAPTLNPLSEFASLDGVKDEIAPTVNAIAFRLDSDFGSQALIKDPTTGQPALQRVRDTDRYFQNTVTVGNEKYTHLGKFAVAASAKETTSGPKDIKNVRIDFVVSAYDTFGSKALPGTQKLNPYSFEIRVSGTEVATQAADSGWIRSFDFGKVPSTQGVNDFLKLDNTRTLYENDTKHNSVFYPTQQGGDPNNPF